MKQMHGTEGLKIAFELKEFERPASFLIKRSGDMWQAAIFKTEGHFWLYLPLIIVCVNTLLKTLIPCCFDMFKNGEINGDVKSISDKNSTLISRL